MRCVASGWATLLLAIVGPLAVYGQELPRFQLARQLAQPAAYEIYCFHVGPPTAQDVALQQEVAELAQSHANVAFTAVDVERDPELTRCSPAAREAWLSRSELSRIRYAVFAPNGAELYASDDPPPGIAGLVQSPAREQLVAELSSQTAGVFVFLPGDDAVVNAECETALSALVQEINATAHADARAAWLNVDVHHLAEAWFVQTLRLLDDGAAPSSAEPLICLVYGRARALPAVAGPRISREQLRADWESIVVVAGPLDKSDLPGMDLPVEHDWDLVFRPDLTVSGDSSSRDKRVQPATAEAEIAREMPDRAAAQRDVEPLPISLSLISACVATGLLALLWLMYVILRPS